MSAATFIATPHLVPRRAATAQPATSYSLTDDIRPGRIAFVLEAVALGLATLWTSVLVCNVLAGAF